jgi:hypothetical protein
LAACGLIRQGFVPDEAIQELRSLLCASKQRSREQGRHIQRIQNTLEEANIKLDTVISDIMGVSSRRMIEAMIGSVRDPHKLAALADHGLTQGLVLCAAWAADRPPSLHARAVFDAG